MSGSTATYVHTLTHDLATATRVCGDKRCRVQNDAIQQTKIKDDKNNHHGDDGDESYTTVNKKQCRHVCPSIELSSEYLIDPPTHHHDKQEQARAQQHTRKRVQFCDSHYNQIISSTIVLSDEELQTLWWTEEEYKTQTNICDQIAVYYTQNCTEYVEKYYQLLCKCMQNKHHNDYKIFNNQNNHAAIIIEELYLALYLVTSPNARGLEKLIIPAVEYQKSRMMQSVLETQACIPKNVNENERGKLIAGKASRQSYVSAKIAEHMARGDALAALGI